MGFPLDASSLSCSSAAVCARDRVCLGVHVLIRSLSPVFLAAEAITRPLEFSEDYRGNVSAFRVFVESFRHSGEADMLVRAEPQAVDRIIGILFGVAPEAAGLVRTELDRESARDAL